MSNTRTRFRWWWGWKAESIEHWLEAQEADGWNLERAGGMGILFTFRRGERRRMAYRVDYQTDLRDDYVQLFEDAGWSLVGQGSGWYYWRQAYDDVKPEIYTDVESLISRNRRQMRILGILLAMQILLMNTVYSRADSPFTGILALIHFTVTAALGFAIFRFIQANRRLRAGI
jgi:hypothetical protein